MFLLLVKRPIFLLLCSYFYIIGFAFEGEFVGDYPNCLSGKTSEVAIVVGPSCTVYQLAGEELCKLLDYDGMIELLVRGCIFA